ncbi:MAG TPA: hypothetical protein VF729_10180, partial [Solirubrobacterales bacterium]
MRPADTPQSRDTSAGFVARLAESDEVEAILIPSRCLLHCDEIRVAADSEVQIVELHLLGPRGKLSIRRCAGWTLDDVKSPKHRLETGISAERKRLGARRISGDRVSARQYGIQIPENGRETLEVAPVGTCGYVGICRRSHEAVGHDRDTTDHDEINIT